VLENAIKTLQKVVDVRGMGKATAAPAKPAAPAEKAPAETEKTEATEPAKTDDAKADAPKADALIRYDAESDADSRKVIEKQEQMERFVNRAALETRAQVSAPIKAKNLVQKDSKFFSEDANVQQNISNLDELIKK